MGRSWDVLLILGLFLNVAQCLESLELHEEQQVEVTTTTTTITTTNNNNNNMTGTGEPEVYMNCSHLLEAAMVKAENVQAPDLHILVSTEMVNGTHLQTVSCLAIGGRPAAQVSWLISGLPPSRDIFTAQQTQTLHPNCTSTLVSTLHFPTHLQDHDHVTCVLEHPAHPEPVLLTARVDTFVRPNVSMKAEMLRQGGSDYWVVSCVASGGRPDTDVILALDSEEEEEPRTVKNLDLDSQILWTHLPVAKYEGYNVSCVFNHPKFTHEEVRVVTLPTFYLSGAELLLPALENTSVGVWTSDAIELIQGQTGVLIRMNVAGNVPSYSVTCTKDAGALPGSIVLVDNDLSIDGPLSPLHSGLYQCVFSYHHHTATLQFNLTVQVAPSIRVHVQADGKGGVVAECLAADAVPEAEVSWVLPEGVLAVPSYSHYSLNGSHSVRGLVQLPACTPRGLTAHCLINHPALEKSQSRSVEVPLCARPNISLSSHPEWRGEQAYTKVLCSVESVAPAADISWTLLSSDSSSSSSVEWETEIEVQADGSVSTHSSVELLSALYSGHNLSCVVHHLSLEVPEERTLLITQHKAPVLKASVERPRGSPLWRAECVCSGEGVGTDLSWTLPDHLQNHTSLDSSSEGSVETVRLTYLFTLSEHEGQDLSCVHRSPHGLTQTRTVHVPQLSRPNIRLSSRPEWREGQAYTKVQCSVESEAPAADISWTLLSSDSSSSSSVEWETEREVQADGSVSTHSSVELLTALYSGHNLSCVVDHLSLEVPEERTLLIAQHKTPVLRASVEQGSPLWRAECVCSGEGVGTDLSWTLPDHLQNHTSLDSSSEGSVETVRLTYLFTLSEHEGQDLSCVHRSPHGLTQTRTVHVPQLYLSLKVVNHTALLQDRYGVSTGVLRLSLQESQTHQRILLQVEGSAPDYTLTCQRSDGSFVHMEGAAIVFYSELTAQDEGLYTCHASLYHHTAAVSIQVEVIRPGTQLFIWTIVSASSVLAVSLILAVVFWVYCKRNTKSDSKKQDSLSALTSLLQEPGSPVKKGPVLIEEEAQLVNYSIVIDVKSTV